MFMGQRVIVVGNGNGDYIDDMRGEFGTVVAPDRYDGCAVIVKMDVAHILPEFVFYTSELMDVEGALRRIVGQNKDVLLEVGLSKLGGYHVR